MLMARNLLYTAVTRARNCVVLVGREAVLSEMIRNNFISHRYTALARAYATTRARWAMAKSNVNATLCSSKCSSSSTSTPNPPYPTRMRSIRHARPASPADLASAHGAGQSDHAVDTADGIDAPVQLAPANQA